MTVGVLHVNDLERAWMLLAVDDGADTSQISAASHHDEIARLEANVIGDFAGGDVELDRVVDLDGWVRIADGAAIVRDEEWDFLGRHSEAFHLAELVFSFISSDTVNGEASLDVIDETEELASLLDGHDVHESSWEVDVGADLSVDFDETLHDDLGDLSVGERVLETVTQEDDEWQGLAQLVWTL